MTRYVVQEMFKAYDKTLWEDRNEYYEMNDAITSCKIDSASYPGRMFRVATVNYNL